MTCLVRVVSWATADYSTLLDSTARARPWVPRWLVLRLARQQMIRQHSSRVTVHLTPAVVVCSSRPGQDAEWSIAWHYHVRKRTGWRRTFRSPS
ncbi:hypothetical protein [Nonomuraea sp. bgisy094]|uniref:hypothetical protein n=1 Tax=Nonomuraea sp. bgisy094 TaxID=3413781 RepID=UPI003EB97626